MDTQSILKQLKAGNLSAGGEGHLLMELEANLRNESGLPIELYLETRKDDNKLRLQSLEKIANWKRRRGEIKNE